MSSTEEPLDLSKPTENTIRLTALNKKSKHIVFDSDDENEKEQEKFRNQCAINSLIEERKTMINSLYHLNQEIEQLEKKLAQPKVINEITPEKFRNILSEMGYIKK